MSKKVDAESTPDTPIVVRDLLPMPEITTDMAVERSWFPEWVSNDGSCGQAAGTQQR